MTEPKRPEIVAIEERLSLGDLPGALALMKTEAERLIGSDDSRQAVLAATSAARVAVMAGEPTIARKLLEAVAKHAKSPDDKSRILEAEAELAEIDRGSTSPAAWQRVVQEGDGAQKIRALFRLAEMQTAEAPKEALIAYDELVSLAVRDGNRMLELEARIPRAAVRGALGDYQGGEEDLATVEKKLSDSSDDKPYRARVHGQRGVFALAQEDFDRALAEAEAARAAAVAAADVMTYLPAAYLVSTVERARGNDVGAYDALVRARASLKQLLGDKADNLVEPAFVQLAETLGAPRYQAVQDEWKAKRQAEKI